MVTGKLQHNAPCKTRPGPSTTSVSRHSVPAAAMDVSLFVRMLTWKSEGNREDSAQRIQKSRIVFFFKKVTAAGGYIRIYNIYVGVDADSSSRHEQ